MMKLKPLGTILNFKRVNYCTGARTSISRFMMGRMARKTGNIAIQGSYTTGNVGDLAAGISLRHGLVKAGIEKVCLFSHDIEDFQNYKMFILGGGGCLYDIKDNLAKRLQNLGKFKKSLVVGVGVQGAIKSETGKKSMERLGKADAISVRDRLSRDKLEEFVGEKALEVTACPSFIMSPTGKHTGSFWERSIGVSLRDWLLCEHGLESHDHELARTILDKRNTYINEMRKMLTELGKENSLIFIPFTYEDIIFARSEFNDVPMYLAPLQSPGRTLNLVNSVQKMIAMRYHSLVFSILAEKPVFSIAYYDKLNALIGEEFQNLEWADIDRFPRDYTPRFSISIEEIREVKKRMRKRALRNIDLILENYREVEEGNCLPQRNQI